MNDDASTGLTAAEAAELEALAGLAKKARLSPNTPEWARYLELVARKQTAPAVPEPGAEVLVLNPDLPPVPRGLAAFVPLYASDGEKEDNVLRALKRWKTAGRKASDPPPLADPVEMLAWYERLHAGGHYTHKTCARLESAALRYRSPAPARVVTPSPSPVPAPSPESESPPAEVPEYIPAADETSPAHSLRRLEIEEANLANELRRLRKESASPDEINRARTQWRDTHELLGQQRLRVEKSMIASGDLLRKSALRQELAAIHAAIPGRIKLTFRNAYEAARTALESPAAWAAFVEAKTDEAAAALVETNFTFPSLTA